MQLEEEEARTAIETVHGFTVYRLRGRLLPLVYLSRELRLVEAATPAAGRDGVINIVVLRAEGRLFGLIVDEINDTQDIVVKPLRKQLRKVATFSGSSIMGDGRVALILDVLGLAQRANVISEARDRALAQAKVEAAISTAERNRYFFCSLG